MTKDERKEKRMTELYRSVFCCPDGVLVLTDMLNDLGFFSAHVGGEDVVRNNYARLLLYKIGAWKEHNIWSLTEQLSKLPAERPGG